MVFDRSNERHLFWVSKERRKRLKKHFWKETRDLIEMASNLLAMASKNIRSEKPKKIIRKENLFLLAMPLQKDIL